MPEGLVQNAPRGRPADAGQRARGMLAPVEFANANAWLGFSYGMAGRTSDARAMLAALHTTAKTQYVSPDRFAIVHFGLGEREEAFRWLEQAFEQRTFDLRGITIGLFSFLHDDPRFRDLLRRMGLADFKEFKV